MQRGSSPTAASKRDGFTPLRAGRAPSKDGSAPRPHHDVGKESRDARESANQKNSDKHETDERQHSPDDVGKRYVGGDILDHENVQAYRWMDQSHFHDDGHDDSEPDKIESGDLERRKDDRNRHQNDAHGWKKETKRNEKEPYQRDQHPLRKV